MPWSHETQYVDSLQPSGVGDLAIRFEMGALYFQAGKISEAIQEFQVIQHRWTAEQGRSVGGIVNVITKSGANEFHGTVFELLRNTALNANDWFANSTGAARAVLRR